MEKKRYLIDKPHSRQSNTVSLIFYLLSIILMTVLGFIQYIRAFKAENSSIDISKLLDNPTKAIHELLTGQVVDNKHLLLMSLKGTNTSSLWFISYENGFQADRSFTMVLLLIVIGSAIFVLIISIIRLIINKLNESFIAYKSLGISTPFFIFVMSGNMLISIIYDGTDMEKKYEEETVISFYKTLFTVSLIFNLICILGTMLIYCCMGNYKGGISNFIFKKIFLSSMILFNIYYAFYCINVLLFLNTLPSAEEFVEKNEKFYATIKLCSWMSIVFFNVILAVFSWIYADILLGAGATFMTVGILTLSANIEMNSTLQSLLKKLESFEYIKNFENQPDAVRNANVITGGVMLGLIVISTVAMVVIRRVYCFK